MRRHLFLTALAIAMAAGFCASLAIAAGGQGAAANATKAAALSFDAPLVLRGTLGEDQVQMRLRPKAVAAEGIEGEYFVFGRSRTILLAGEPDGAGLFLEESENGTDVSGHWNARIEGDTISGDWAAPGGTVTKRFVLKAVPAEAKAQRVRNDALKPAAASIR